MSYKGLKANSKRKTFYIDIVRFDLFAWHPVEE